MVLSLMMTDANGNAPEKKSSENSSTADVEKNSARENPSDAIFINHAAISWHESRRKWLGNQSQNSERVPKEPIISWSMDYEDLLSTHDPFPEPIPLPEMVDFLVDIWYDDGLIG